MKQTVFDRGKKTVFDRERCQRCTICGGLFLTSRDSRDAHGGLAMASSGGLVVRTLRCPHARHTHTHVHVCDVHI